MERLFLRPAEVAQLLGFCRTSVYKLIRDEAIPYCKVGKSIRISVAALQEWARTKGMEVGSAPPPSTPHRKRTKAKAKRTTSRKGVN